MRKPKDTSVSTTHRYPEGHRVGVHSSAPFAIEISNTQSGRSFKFGLRGHYLKAEGKAELDWYKELTEREKVDLMREVLAHYRKPSADKDGMKASAAGVIPNGDVNCAARDRHMIYVGFNTPDAAHDFLKNCAEKNVINEAHQAILGHMEHKLGIHNPELPKFIEFHVMGGRDADPYVKGDKGVPAICSCGQCTDRMAHEMIAGGKVYIYPHSEHPSLKLNHAAEHFGQVKADEVWCTTIDHLNKNRVVELSAEENNMQRDGLTWLAENVRKPLPDVSEAVIAQTVKNKEAHRKSIEELDVATKNGVPDIMVMRDYLRQEIVKTLCSRLKDTYGKVPSDPDIIRQWMDQRLRRIRASVILTDDGCYHLGKDSQTSTGKAFPDSGIAGVSAAIDSLGNHGVAKIWSMEVNPKAVEAGLLYTMSKDSLERAFKRGTCIKGNELTTSDLPFCDDLVSRHALEAIVKRLTFSQTEVNPGLFGGSGMGGKGFADKLNRSPRGAGPVI